MRDPDKLHSLEAFADSFNIVDWIRKETPQGMYTITTIRHTNFIVLSMILFL